MYYTLYTIYYILSIISPGENQHLQLDKESLGDSYAMAREKRHEQRQQTAEESTGHSTSEPPPDTASTRGKSAPSIRQRKFRRLVRNGPRKKT